MSSRRKIQSIESGLLALLLQTGDSSHTIYALYDLLAKIGKEKSEGVKETLLTTKDVLLLTLRMYAMMGSEIIIENEHEKYLMDGFVNSMMAVIF